MPRLVNIRFAFVQFREDADIIGTNEVHFRAHIAGVQVGSFLEEYQAVRGDIAILPAGWDHDVDFNSTGEVAVRFEVLDEEVFSYESMGRVSLTLRWPFVPRTYTLVCPKYEVDVIVSHSEYGGASPGFTQTFVPRREVAGTPAATAAAPPATRVEVHDCLPVPSGTAAPNRPTFPAGTIPYLDTTQAAVLTTGPNNALYNPAVIPILPSSETASDSNCAKFKVTYVCPNNAPLGTNYSELTWHVVRQGGNAAFHGGNTGKEVKLHGRTTGDVLLQVRHRDVVVAAIRVYVAPLVYIPCRAQKLTTGGDTPTTSTVTASAILDHLNCANRYLWQMGVLLRLESDTSVGWLPTDIAASAVTASGTTGIFNVTAPDTYISNVPTSTLTPCINARPRVMNFVYAVSYAPGNATGAAFDYGGNPANQADEGTPSTSWIKPSGVPPDGEPSSHTMRLYNRRISGRPADVFTMLILEPGSTAAAVMGATIAHEVAHCMGLGHRGPKPDGTNPAYYDDLAHPPTENIMYYARNSTKADFDIIQAKAIRRSPLVRGS